MKKIILFVTILSILFSFGSFAESGGGVSTSTPPPSVSGGGSVSEGFDVSYYADEVSLINNSTVETKLVFSSVSGEGFFGSCVIAVYHEADKRLISVSQENIEISADDWAQNGAVTKKLAVSLPETDTAKLIAKAIMLDDINNLMPVCKQVTYNLIYPNCFLGVIIEVERIVEFNTIFQLKILKTNGAIETFNLCKKINGIVYNPNAFDFEGEFKKGTLVAYGLNSKNEIINIAPATSSIVGLNLESFDTSLIGDELLYERYTERFSKIGRYYISDNTVIFVTDADRNEITESNIMLYSQASLIDDNVYLGVVIANEENEAYAVVLFQTPMNYIRADSYPMVITRKSELQVDGASRVRYTGYVNGEEIELTVAKGNNELGNFNTNDVILYAVNGWGEMVNARLLAGLNNGRYEVLTNWINDGIFSGHPVGDDEFLPVQGFSLLADKTVTPDRSNAVIGGRLSPKSLRGIAVAGKAYQLKDKSLQLTVGNDFSLTYQKSDGSRGYNRDSRNFGLISDIEISSGSAAYIYNGNTGSMRVAAITDLETDKSTNDYKTDNFDNDDTVYVYNYDGKTYFILIVDAQGDN